MSALNNIIQAFSRAVPPNPGRLLSDIPMDLMSVWGEKAAFYRKCWDWYEGRKLEETKEDGQTGRYPLRVNPFKWICRKHARALFGQAPERAESLVEFGFRNEAGQVDETCETAAAIVNRIWAESSGAEIQFHNGIVSQILGGSVFKAHWMPGAKGLRRLSYGVRISQIIPDYFLPVWDKSDPWDLIEGYLVYCISPKEAVESFGVDVGRNQYPIYMEKWTRYEYEITVDGKEPKGGQFPWKGENPWGFVPLVYIPHEDRADGYYGYSHLPGIEALCEEYNWRMADRGDGIRSANRDIQVMWNTGSGLKVRRIEGYELLDLGNTPVGTNREPGAKTLESGAAKAGEASQKFTDDLWRQICNDSDTPEAAYGIDVSSQRSGLSRDYDLQPLVDHIRGERIMTTAGYNLLNTMVMRMLNVKMPDLVTDEMIALTPTTRWHDILPRDRDQLVNEMVQRRAVQLVSLRNAVEQLSRGEDPGEEFEEILRDIERGITQSRGTPPSYDSSAKKANPKQERSSPPV